ncbi:MAG TPA: cytochrome c biogenesis protein CcsA, partial [Candidatus Sulfomarinibacteraceae bacterium]|nr:cytochrome c biogenesis protein CcsA [Candidatus Sulfomarinibacteraceae bacterium]
MYIPGTVLLWLAFGLGLGSTVAYALTIRDPERWRPYARQSYALMTAAIVIASGLLMYLLVTHDYRLHYVWAYSDNMLPLHYLISTFWAGQEGSFLLWIFWGVLLGLPLMRYARAYESRAMIFYNLTLLSLIMLLLRQDPFRFHEGLTAAMMPMDGQGMNPLLQNPWMVIHPPIMFIGYAALAVPFAFALAALWMERYDEWTKVTLPWVLLGLFTLGTAIMLGGYWAYETLGWGGYWGWDPVENASLVPWLITAALTHGMLLQRSRKRFRRLNLVLAVAAFLLVVYATFLTRSGVLSDFSVHSFVDLGITGWLIFNMGFFLIVSTGLLALRWRAIPTEVGDEPFLSRTIFSVVGILLFILVGLVVLVGTSAPILTQLWGQPAQVGPEYYNAMGFWIAVVFALFLAGTPFLAWSRAREHAGRILAGTLAVTVAGLVLAAFLGLEGWRSFVYVGAVLFTIVANGWAVLDYARHQRWSLTGGPLAHVGMGLMMLAFLTTGWLDQQSKIRLRQDQPVQVLGYTMTFRGIEKPTPMARDAMVVEVTDERGKNFVLRPKMWVNQKSNQLVANPDIKSFLTSDLYLAPVEFDPGAEPPPSARFMLTKGEPKDFNDWTLTFQGFDMSKQNSVPGALTVGVQVRLERPDHEPVLLEPSMISTDQGVQAVAVDIPGVPGGRLRATGMNVDGGIVRIELLGLGGGIGRTAVLHKGETLAYEGLEITFSGFDLSDFDPDAGKINFGVVFSVEVDGRTIEVVPSYRGGMEGDPVVTPAIVPGSGGITLTPGRIDAENGAVQLQVFDPTLPAAAPEPASLVLDVSTKPLIILVWIGTLLVMAGIV